VHAIADVPGAGVPVVRGVRIGNDQAACFRYADSPTYAQHQKQDETTAGEINRPEEQRASRACPNRHHTTKAFIVPEAETEWGAYPPCSEAPWLPDGRFLGAFLTGANEFVDTPSNIAIWARSVASMATKLCAIRTPVSRNTWSLRGGDCLFDGRDAFGVLSWLRQVCC
jgi:hypothetical protein